MQIISSWPYTLALEQCHAEGIGCSHYFTGGLGIQCELHAVSWHWMYPRWTRVRLPTAKWLGLLSTYISDSWLAVLWRIFEPRVVQCWWRLQWATNRGDCWLPQCAHGHLFDKFWSVRRLWHHNVFSIHRCADFCCAVRCDRRCRRQKPSLWCSCTMLVVGGACLSLPMRTWVVTRFLWLWSLVTSILCQELAPPAIPKMYPQWFLVISTCFSILAFTAKGQSHTTLSWSLARTVQEVLNADCSRGAQAAK